MWLLPSGPDQFTIFLLHVKIISNYFFIVNFFYMFHVEHSQFINNQQPMFHVEHYPPIPIKIGLRSKSYWLSTIKFSSLLSTISLSFFSSELSTSTSLSSFFSLSTRLTVAITLSSFNFINLVPCVTLPSVEI